MKYRLIVLTTSLILMSASSLLADDYRKADSFFKKDDSKDISKGGFYDTGKIDYSSMKKSEEVNKIVSSDFSDKAKQNVLDRRDNIGQNKPVIPSSSTSNIAGTKVLSLGVIINSMDANHLERHMNTLINASTKLDLDIGEVDFIGIDSDISHKYDMAIVSRFGKGRYLSTPPLEYNISASPTWVLQTKDGQILLEGIDNPQSYMNSKAEFIDGGTSPYQDNDRDSGFFGEKNSGMAFF